MTFDDLAGGDQALNGQYPNGVINWGTDRWHVSGPWRELTTNSISFRDGTLTSATFAFVTPRRLVRLDAYNGGSRPTTVSIACAGQRTKTVNLAAGRLTTISTGWRGTCSTVTISSTNGWDTNFDNLVLDGG